MTAGPPAQGRASGRRQKFQRMIDPSLAVVLLDFVYFFTSCHNAQAGITTNQTPQ